MSHPDQGFGDRTYSQFGEDLIILNAFNEIGRSSIRYFDVGAHHPFNISNTGLLYERGHRGICVEANPNLIDNFTQFRPDDLILNLGVDVVPGVLEFYMIDDHSGRNTFSFETAKKFVEESPEFKISKVISVKTVTIDNLFLKFGVPDLLSLDIEGLDYPVLQGMKSRPAVICVENEHRIDEFDDLLKTMKYDKLFNTVANGIYIHENCTRHRNKPKS